MPALPIAAIQPEIVWENPTANFQRLERWLTVAHAAGRRLVILPEMFACGFSMNTPQIQERPGGPTETFLREQAQAHGMWIAGSLPLLREGASRPANTLLFVGPEGQRHAYEKLHPFTYAREHEHYAPGDAQLTFELEGLRITAFICYDLRFANVFWERAPQTDAYVVVANWPRPRRAHWRALLRARAIENQAYVIGVNRVGVGGKLEYAGDSAVISPTGDTITEATETETMLLADLDPALVDDTRERFPFLRDRRAVPAAPG